MKILVFDNYDSFTYNLVHYIEKVADTIEVDIHRNDKININEIEKYDKIVLSPGSGLPKDAGILLDVIKKFAPHKSILGVCLGHQAIAEAFGCSLKNLNTVFHGVATPITVIKEDVLFENISPKFSVGRYHSWVIDNTNFPEELEITATDDKGNIMGICHKKYNVRGVQFHPESILTEHGFEIIKNWVLS
jgi:anthranilate synthase component 2